MVILQDAYNLFFCEIELLVSCKESGIYYDFHIRKAGSKIFLLQKK